MNGLNERILLIDVSAIAYLHSNKATYATTFKNHVLELCKHFDTDKVCFVMESSVSCFRHKYATTKDYKGTRNKEKVEEYLPYLRDFFKWFRMYIPHTMYLGIENDDVLSILARRYNNLIMCANDSDLLAIPGTHYNLKSREITNVSLPGIIAYDSNSKKLYATGIFNTYAKILTGAAKENYQGLKGVGPKRAYELLKDCTTEEELQEKLYLEFYSKAGPEKGKELLEEGYTLCHLLEHNNSFKEPFVINFPEYANTKLIW